MHSELMQLGPVTIHWYGVMMALGFIAGLVNWALLGRREQRSFNDCSDLMFWVMVSGIVGARIAYVLSEWSHYASHPLTILRVDQGGLIYYGGFIGAGIALVVIARKRGEPLFGLFDFVVTSVPLAHAFGRIGCFLNGCCFGRLCDGWQGVTFPADSLVWWDHVVSEQILRFAERSLPVHPVQLYEAGFNLVVYGLVLWHFRRRRYVGTTSAMYLLTYPVGRFFLEFFRGHEREFWFGVPVAQWVSIGLLLCGVIVFLWARKRKIPSGSRQERKTPAPASTAG